MSLNLQEILQLPDGPKKTAALACWVQNLYPTEAERPVLVGGAAVELMTGGGYTTGDLDFVGALPEGVVDALSAAGFRQHGRHWIHERGQVFLEFPGETLSRHEKSVILDFEGSAVRILSPEAVLADRLAAWQFWGSKGDAVNAFLVWQKTQDRIDLETLALIVEERQLQDSWQELCAYIERLQGTVPSVNGLKEWVDGARFQR